MTYSNWVPKHRNNFAHHTIEDCVAMIPYKQGQWDDIPCGHLIVHSPTHPQEFVETHPYICEFCKSLLANLSIHLQSVRH